MKFPGGDRLQQLRRALFPTDAEVEADHQARLAQMRADADAEAAERRRAREADANDFRRACAGRLAPYIGGLIVVTNFKGVGLKTNADRIRDAVLDPANFGVDAPIGISVIMSDDRESESHKELKETAQALMGSFADSIGDRAFSLRPQREGPDLWLLSLTRAAEDTARQANLPPAEVGCIAVVSALDMSRVNFGYPEPATALKLTQISEQAYFDLQTISARPNERGL